ncbi:NAD/NADP-dependent betaine aldehyde dehydrogenase [Streptomyces fumanus]
MASVFEYAPAPESRSIVDIAPSYGLFIDGEFVEAADGKVFKTVSPSTEEVLSEVAQAGEADVDRAVQAARKAFEKWSALPGSERAKYLFRIARIIQERGRQELAVLETLDNGKPIKETRDADLPLVAAHFFYYAGWADKLDHAGFGANPRPLAQYYVERHYARGANRTPPPTPLQRARRFVRTLRAAAVQRSRPVVPLKTAGDSR